MRRRRFVIPVVLLLAAALVLVIRNQVRVSRSRRADAERSLRHTVFVLLRPVALSNCELARFGEANDGGYLMCGNLLDEAKAVYSYGIAGFDGWGCDLSTRLRAQVHEYDCFDTKAPACPGGDAVFHPECVSGERRSENHRLFDTISNQLAKNNDASKRIVVKMDVEGAEWDALLRTPDRVLNSIDQMAVEFHWIEKNGGGWVHDERYAATLRRLRQFFHVVHVHFNNASCVSGLDPFPSWAYEVLFVNKRLGVVATPPTVVSGPHALDAPNAAGYPDCQVALPEPP